MLTKIPMIMCVSVFNMNIFLFKSKFMDNNILGIIVSFTFILCIIGIATILTKKKNNADKK